MNTINIHRALYILSKGTLIHSQNLNTLLEKPTPPNNQLILYFIIVKTKISISVTGTTTRSQKKNVNRNKTLTFLS